MFYNSWSFVIKQALMTRHASAFCTPSPHPGASGGSAARGCAPRECEAGGEPVQTSMDWGGWQCYGMGVSYGLVLVLTSVLLGAVGGLSLSQAGLCPHSVSGAGQMGEGGLHPGFCRGKVQQHWDASLLGRHLGGTMTQRGQCWVPGEGSLSAWAVVRLQTGPALAPFPSRAAHSIPVSLLCHS